MKIIAVSNIKGGVGKTSLTMNLASYLAFKGARCLLVDLDSQASLSFSFVTPEQWQLKFASNLTIKTWLESYLQKQQFSLASMIDEPAGVNMALPYDGRVGIVYSHLGLFQVEQEIALSQSAPTIAMAKRKFVDVHTLIAKGLAEPIIQQRYDFCFLDCPPNLGLMAKNAILASDVVLIPTVPDGLAAIGLDTLMRGVTETLGDYAEFSSEHGRNDLRISNEKAFAVIYTMVSNYAGTPVSLQRNVMNKLAANSGLHVFQNYISRSSNMARLGTEITDAHGNPERLEKADIRTFSGIEHVADEFQAFIKKQARGLLHLKKWS